LLVSIAKDFLKGNDPFIFASQASQVFYCDDVASIGWLIIVKMQPRDAYDISIASKNEVELEDYSSEYFQMLYWIIVGKN